MQLATVNNEVGVYDRMANPIEAVEKLGEWIARSGMFGCDKVEQGQILALQCMVERKAPMEMSKTYHIIGGKLSMRSDAMLAEYRKRGGKVIWKSFDDKLAKAVWVYDGNEIELSYSIDEARKAGLIKEKSGWMKDPAAMLRARLISKAIRMLAPEVCTGVYTPEETADFTVPLVELKAAKVACPLEELLSVHEPMVNHILLDKGLIAEGQTFRDLPQDKKDNILKNPKPLLEVLNDTE